MRLQDENKRNQIYDATAQLINELGFTNVSMSKIAKVAGVSKAGLYTYFKDKEDMFEKTYIHFKQQMLTSCLDNIDDTDTMYSTVMQFCNNLLTFIKSNEERFMFLEQCNSDPKLKAVQSETIDNLMQKHIEIFQKGIDDQILKDVHPLLLISFCVFSINQIYKEYNHENSVLGEIRFDNVFLMTWDAIKR